NFPMHASSPRALKALLLAAALAPPASDGHAQGWGWWPWSQPPPVPREPVYRQPPGQLPPGELPPGQMPGQAPGQPPSPPPGFGPRQNNICQQLEQRLVGETQSSGQGRELLPKIESDMRGLERSYQAAQMQLNRADCWDQFLFSKTLRRTQRCIQ